MYSIIVNTPSPLGSNGTNLPALPDRIQCGQLAHVTTTSRYQYTTKWPPTLTTLGDALLSILPYSSPRTILIFKNTIPMIAFSCHRQVRQSSPTPTLKFYIRKSTHPSTNKGPRRYYHHSALPNRRRHYCRPAVAASCHPTTGNRDRSALS